MANTRAPLPNLTGRRVLVVEDEYFIADDIARALSKLGAEVVGPASDLHDAANLVTARPVDWAVLDINLQGEMVYPVAQALKERGIPFLFATGYGQSSIPPGYANVPRWEKPFDAEALAQVLPALLCKSATV
jgi:CheY-like chemotaxis protein